MSMALTGLNVFLEQTSTSTLRRLWVDNHQYCGRLPNVCKVASRQRKLLARDSDSRPGTK